MSNQIVVFTQEDKNKKADLLAKIGEALEDSEVAKLQSEIVKLNKKQKQATEQRGEFVTSIFKQITELKIEFKELIEGKVYNEDIVKAYAQEHGWIKEAKKTKTTSTKTGEEKEPLYVGTFKFSEYGFTMPKKKGKEELMGKGETELKWDWNKAYGGLAWQNKFIDAILAKGYVELVKKAEKESPDFIKWLNEFKVGEGPKAGQEIYEHKREFLKAFDIKPADADKIELFPKVAEKK
jgi:hypothetical protein